MKILLHACCGVCASHCVDLLLSRGDDVVLFYSNANIFPHAEFLRRQGGVETLAEHYRVPLVVDAPEHADWRERVARGFEKERERGARCPRCFGYSLERAAEAMRRLDCDAFTTTLTVSPYKPSRVIFDVGRRTDDTHFLEVDFKKKDGYRRSREIAAALGIYRQCYCGCEFSLRDRELAVRAREAEMRARAGTPAEALC